jgi:hypothetical protein
MFSVLVRVGGCSPEPGGPIGVGVPRGAEPFPPWAHAV